jgi:hypothetical protein
MLYATLSCTTNLPTTLGKPRKLVLLTSYRTNIENQISVILEQNIYTVQPEPEFLIRYEPLLNADAFLKFHLIFFVGTIDEEPIATLINKQREKIINDTFGLFSFTEPWTKGQKVLVFAVKNPELLEIGLTRYAERIRKTFREYLLTYMNKITYERGYDQKLTKRLSEKYDYTIQVPYNFKINDQYAQDNFVYLVAHNPDRSIFLYSDPQAQELVPSKLIDYRNMLTQKFYDSDYVYRNLTKAETTLFNDIWSIKFTGVWQNNQATIGGPFVAYCFNYQQRFYFIDGVLYNPGKKKLDNLNQLDAILHTFKVTNKN